MPAKPSTSPRTKPAVTAPALSFKIDCTLKYRVDGPSEFLFLLHALHGADQVVSGEALELETAGGAPYRVYPDPSLGHRFLRTQAQAGELLLRYRATVRRKPPKPHRDDNEVAVCDIPDELLHYLMPTRYCQSDILGRAAQKHFGGLPPGLSRVQAVSDWIHDNIDYQIGSTRSTTSAAEVYLARAGVCRDFAHLGVTFCRALNIPARLVAGYAIFNEPPPDFHAAFEAYVGGRWVIFDPTQMAKPEHLVRIASGRDAKDVAFATIFGPAQMVSMAPLIEVLPVAAEPSERSPAPRHQGPQAERGQRGAQAAQR